MPLPDWANGFDEPYQHRDDGFVFDHRRLDDGAVDLLAAPRDVQPGDDLDRRAPRDSVEARLLRSAELTGAFGDVGDHGSGGTVELVANTSSSRR